jgi:hypothetical protein
MPNQGTVVSRDDGSTTFKDKMVLVTSVNACASTIWQGRKQTVKWINLNRKS